jgi:hypothetical protein
LYGRGKGRQESRSRTAIEEIDGQRSSAPSDPPPAIAATGSRSARTSNRTNTGYRPPTGIAIALAFGGPCRLASALQPAANGRSFCRSCYGDHDATGRFSWTIHHRGAIMSPRRSHLCTSSRARGSAAQKPCNQRGRRRIKLGGFYPRPAIIFVVVHSSANRSL